MKTPTNLKELNKLILSHLRRGVCTNFFVSADTLESELSEGRIFCEESDGFLAIYLARDGFSQMYFYSNSEPPESLCDSNIVCEIANEPPQFIEDFGFTPILSRIHMTREKSECESEFSHNVVFLPSEKAEEAFRLLHSCFDEKTAALPTLSELRRECENRLVYALVFDGKLCGLLRSSQSAKKAEIRHLCVDEKYRKKHFASELCVAFCKENSEKTISVWTGAENIAAQRLYASFGFADDGKRSTVYFKRAETKEN